MSMTVSEMLKEKYQIIMQAVEGNVPNYNPKAESYDFIPGTMDEAKKAAKDAFFEVAHQFFGICDGARAYEELVKPEDDKTKKYFASALVLKINEIKERNVKEYGEDYYFYDKEE